MFGAEKQSKTVKELAARKAVASAAVGSRPQTHSDCSSASPTALTLAVAGDTKGFWCIR